MKIADKENSICYFFPDKKIPLYLILERARTEKDNLRCYALAGPAGVAYGFVLETPDNIILADLETKSKITFFKDVDTLTAKDGHIGWIIDFDSFINEFQKMAIEAVFN